MFLQTVCYNREDLIPASEDLMRILQYVFCILSVLCAASAVIVGIFTKSVLGAAIVAAGCIFFAVLMLLVKKKLEPPAPKKRDFMDEVVPPPAPRDEDED